MKVPHKIIFIVGPTAVGKSEIAMRMAQKLDGEIVCCDSMQVYREINILSAKPDEGTMKSVSHHLL